MNTAPSSTHLCLSFGKKVSGTQIFSEKSPAKVNTSLFELKDNRSSFQYWFRFMVMVKSYTLKPKGTFIRHSHRD
jgi:hypothetical protein